MKRPIIGYISDCSPDDKKASSGTNYKVCEQLRKIGEVQWIPAKPVLSYRLLELALKAILKPFHKNISLGFTWIGTKLLSYSVDTNSFAKCDVLFYFFGSSRLATVKNLKEYPPIVYLSDATFPAKINYYPPFCNLLKWNKHQGYQIEKAGLDKASAIIFSSHWAAQSAVVTLKQPQEKIHVLPFGANIDEKDIISHTYKYDGHLHLLFLGVEWGRKGGDIAIDACRWLNKHNVKATLHIVGIRNLNDEIKKFPFVDNVGFLNKNISEEYYEGRHSHL